MPLPADLAPSATGKLAKTPLPHLLVYMLDRKLDGTLFFIAADATEHVIYFQQGAPAKARIGYECAHLGRVLLDFGFIDQETYDSTAATREQNGGLHGQMLLSLGKIDENQLLSGLREQLMRRMTRLLAKLDDAAIYMFYAGVNLLDGWGGPELTPVDPLRVLCLGLRARPEFPHVAPVLSRLGTSPMMFHPEAVDLARFGFTTQELAVADLIRTRNASLPDLVASGLLGERSLNTLIYLLLITRNVDLGKRDQPPVGAGVSFAQGPDEIPSSRKPPSAIARVRLKSVPMMQGALVEEVPPPAPSEPPGPVTPGKAGVHASHVAHSAPARPAPAAPLAAAPSAPASRVAPPPSRASAPEQRAPAAPAAPLPASTPEIAAQREAIQSRAKTVEKDNFFKVLGVPENAQLDAMQTAYFALAKQWHPDRLPAELSDVKELAAKVFARMSEAFQTLSDADKRIAYAKALNDSGGNPEEQAQVQQVIEAAIDFQKAEVFLKKRDLEQAEVHARRAFQNDPDQPDYAALLAWIGVLVHDKAGNKDYVEPLRILTAAVDREPRCERAYFYRALLLQRQNHMEQAIRDFRKAMELNPRNIDAAREVRLWDMRGGTKASPEPPAVKAKEKDAKGGGGLLGKLFKR
jgi:tetratricopeptide (TPR) repeat protein